jgi:hypothetical protein
MRLQPRTLFRDFGPSATGVRNLQAKASAAAREEQKSELCKLSFAFQQLLILYLS